MVTSLFRQVARGRLGAVVVSMLIFGWSGSLHRPRAAAASGLYGSSTPQAQLDWVDPERRVPEIPMTQALRFFYLNQGMIRNRGYLSIVDMTQHSSKKRLYLINMESGEVTSYLVAHGQASDPTNRGIASRFFNALGSGATSLGFYLTGARYLGGHGLSLRLHGLESTNSHAFDRAVTLHGAAYVREGIDLIGRSRGCLAVDMLHVDRLVRLLEEGSLLYVWGGQ